MVFRCRYFEDPKEENDEKPESRMELEPETVKENMVQRMSEVRFRLSYDSVA